MGQGGYLGRHRASCREARIRTTHDAFASVELRNTPKWLFWPTEGRFPSRRASVAGLERYPASPCDQRLVTAQMNSGQMAPIFSEVL